MISLPSGTLGGNSRTVWRCAVLLLLAALFIFLAIRAVDKYRWSDWSFGDAQTMLTLKQWHEGGWIHNYLLFKPQGYSPIVDLLDEAGLRQHAHGTSPSSSPRIGPRLWYTHYPSGYLIPFAMLYELGLDNLVAMRLFAIGLSLAALGLMYLVFERITSGRVAFLAVLFYGLSPPFLGYSDSLANMPIDDFLRFTFMYALVMASQASDRPDRQRWLMAAWSIEFVLSLSSFDSVFFVYAWLIGWDFYTKRGFRWKRYLIFALAPLSAHGIQVLQNIWYLGAQDALTDLADAFLVHHVTNTYSGKILTSIILMFKLLNRSFLWGGVFVPVAWVILYWGRSRTFTGADDLPSGKLLLILLLSGLIFPLMLPKAGAMYYESRQVIPFISLVVSGVSWMLVLSCRDAMRNGVGTQMTTAGQIWRVGFLGLSGIMVLGLWINFALSKRSAKHNYTDTTPAIVFARRLKELRTSHPPVFLNYKGLAVFFEPKYMPGYPQIHPVVEYYWGSKTVLCMDEPVALAQDIATLIQKAERPFSPVLITRDVVGAKTALSILAEKGVAKSIEFPDNPVNGIIVMDLTDVVDWENVARTRLATPTR